MPQTIWEDRRPKPIHPDPQYVTPQTDTWAYIGATIKTGSAKDKALVWNGTRNAKIQLNGEYTPVNYSVHPEYNRLTIAIEDEGRDDITQYWLTINTVPATDVKYAFTSPATYVITTGVAANTTYTFNVRAEYQLANEPEAPETGPAADWSLDSIQTHKTPNNPIPTPPLNLRSPNQANSWIDLAWDASANGQAASYQVWSRVGYTGSLTLRATTAAATRTARITGLLNDTKYQWWVVAIGSTGLQSQASNILRWETGHDAVTRSGSCEKEELKPDEWGSWRKDIGWNDWHDWPGDKHRHHWVYQGYWPGPRNYGPTTANTSQREQDGRYKGIVTYDAAGFRARLNARFGYDVGGGFGRGQVTVTKVSIKRPYREREPGNLESQYIRWWIAHATPFSGEPNLREWHRNHDLDDADHISSQDKFKAGTDRDLLRLPRHWGRALVQGWIEDTGTKVNAIGMYRSDNDHNGYGTAGYARFSGHGMHDPMSGYKDNSSNWTILIDARWTITTTAYEAPRVWS